MLFVCVWLGGLLALVVIRRLLDADRLQLVLGRYSSLALVSFIVVAISGYVSAAVRVGDLQNLGTPYGLLVIAKVVALLVLGVLGAVQRRAVIARVRDGAPGWFRLLVAAELLFMGIAAGVAAGLARTAPPVEEVPTTDLLTPSPAAYLTGRELPPELTGVRFLTEWRLEQLWALDVAFGACSSWGSRSPCWPSSGPPRWPSPCWSSACRSSTRSGSSSAACRRAARRSAPTRRTSTIGCSTSGYRTGRPSS